MAIGEILSLLCAFLWAIAVIYYKKAGDHFNAYEMNLFKSVLVFVLMVPTVIIADQLFSATQNFNHTYMFGFLIPKIETSQLFIILSSGFVGIMLADMFYLRALQLIGASLTGITGSLYSPFVVGFSLLFLGESLNLWQYIGMFMVLSGVVLVGYRKKSLDLMHPPIKGFVYAVLAVLFTALGIVMIKPLSNDVPFFWLILIRSFGGMVAMMIYGLVLKKSLAILHIVKKKGGKWLIVGAFIGQYVSMMVWVAGYKYTSASIASILNETASIFILLLSWLMLGEKIDRKKLMGICITMAGVVFVLLLG
jgi:drug/metabolite transporter (DMT)-like permease